MKIIIILVPLCVIVAVVFYMMSVQKGWWEVSKIDSSLVETTFSEFSFEKTEEGVVGYLDTSNPEERVRIVFDVATPVETLELLQDKPEALITINESNEVESIHYTGESLILLKPAQ